MLEASRLSMHTYGLLGEFNQKNRKVVIDQATLAFPPVFLMLKKTVNSENTALIRRFHRIP